MPKKGRPITQCAHCRKERKKRSAHVACGCGITYTTKDKCIHLREAEALSAESSGSETPLTLRTVSEDGPLKQIFEDDQPSDVGCCCHHGGKCTCAGSPSDAQPKNAVTSKARPKPRLTTANSDPHMSSKVIGVHKPSHHHHHHGHVPNVHQQTLQHHLARSKTEQLTSQPAMDAFFGPISSSATPNPETETPPIGEFLDLNATYDGPLFSQQQFTRSVDSFLPLTASFQPTYAEAPANAIQLQSDTGFADPNMSIWMSENNWANIDWPKALAADIPNSGVESASSNTVSEIDQVTPSTIGAAYDGSQVYSTNDFSDFVPNPTAQCFAPVSANSQSKPVDDELTGTNRWSLPASFFGNVNLSLDQTRGQQIIGADNSTTPILPNGFSTAGNMTWDQLVSPDGAGDLWADPGFAGDLMQSTYGVASPATGESVFANSSWLP